MSQVIKTRFLLISDTHDGRPSAGYSMAGAFRQPLPKADVLLHSGDLTMIGTMSQYEKSLQLLESIDAELKLVIAGNHDLSLHESYYKTNPSAKLWASTHWNVDTVQQARELWTGPRAQKAKVVYLEEGLYSFRLNSGAKFSIYASPWQPRFGDWAFNYPHSEDRWNPPQFISDDDAVPAPTEREPHPIPADAQVDIIMTHGPAYAHLDLTTGGVSAGCRHLLKALDRVRPQIHCCGHIHEGWGAERVQWGTGGKGLFGETTEILAGTDRVKRMVRPNDADVIDRRAVVLDVSSSSSRPLEKSRETIFVNSCVVDVQYNPNYSGFVVDLDLFKEDGQIGGR